MSGSRSCRASCCSAASPAGPGAERPALVRAGRGLRADPQRQLGDDAERALGAQGEAEQVGAGGGGRRVAQLQDAGRRRERQRRRPARRSGRRRWSSARPSGWPRTRRGWRTPSSAAGGRRSGPAPASACSSAGPRMPGPTVTRDDGTSSDLHRRHPGQVDGDRRAGRRGRRRPARRRRWCRPPKGTTTTPSSLHAAQQRRGLLGRARAGRRRHGASEASPSRRRSRSR